MPFTMYRQDLGHNPDTGSILIVQCWRNTSTGNHTLVACVNDRVVGTATGSAAGIHARFAAMQQALAGYRRVDEDTARDLLTAIGMPGERRCDTCGQRLPLAAFCCLHCDQVGPRAKPNQSDQTVVSITR